MEDTNRPTHDRTAPDQAPRHSTSELDPSVPHAARVYDYVLGGSEWFPVDREFAEKLLEVAPWVARHARANKGFLSRVVRFLSEQGIRQFIDIGCGLPHKDLVHDIAWNSSPWAKTLYVDYETLVVKRMNNAVDAVDPEHKRLSVMQADMREGDVILESDETRSLIDFTEPVGLLVMSTLPFLGPADDAVGLMARYREALPAGSFFAASHATQEGVPDSVLEQGNKAERLYGSSRNPFYFRTGWNSRNFLMVWTWWTPGLCGHLNGGPRTAPPWTVPGQRCWPAWERSNADGPHPRVRAPTPGATAQLSPSGGCGPATTQRRARGVTMAHATLKICRSPLWRPIHGTFGTTP